MTINLHETGNPINRHERNKINENWQRITEGLNKLQRQIYILAGSQEVDEILERIDKAITDANNATTEVNSKIDEATNLINQLVDLINESQLIINNGNQLINDGAQLINTLTSLKADLEQLKEQLDDIANNEAERIANENTRIANEDERIINEQERVNAETQRNAAFNEQMQQINNVLPNVQGLENRQSWNAETQYYKNNIVERNGNSYQALKDNINQPPPTPPEKSNEFWSMIAQRGVDGTGAVSTVNGVSPDTEGNVELTAYDIDAIPISEKGVVGGVARLNEDGKVVDANGNEVEGKVKSVNNVEPDSNGNIEIDITEINGLQEILDEKANSIDLIQLDNKVNEHLADYKKLGKLFSISQILGQSIVNDTETIIIYEPSDNEYFTSDGSGNITFKKTGHFIFMIHSSFEKDSPIDTTFQLSGYRNDYKVFSDSFKHVDTGDFWSVYGHTALLGVSAGGVINIKIKHTAPTAVNSQWSNITIAYIGEGEAV